MQSQQSDTETKAPDTPTEPSVIAGLWRRLAAFLVDGIIIGLFGFGIGIIFFDYFVAMGGWGRIAGFLLALPYFGLLNSGLCGGRTVGKHLLGIKVVTTNGESLTIGRSFLRSTIIAIPYFLNGAPIPSETAPTIAFGAFIVLVGLGSSLLYLLLFNRRTRQSVHDLVVGSVVVVSDAQTRAIDRQLWRGHFAVVGALCVLSVAGALYVLGLPKDEPTAVLIKMNTALAEIAEVRDVSLTSNWKMVATLQTGQSKTEFVQATVQLMKAPADYEALAEKIAHIVIDAYPQILSEDALVISFVYGFDIGIASGNLVRDFSHPPGEWNKESKERGQSPFYFLRN